MSTTLEYATFSNDDQASFHVSGLGGEADFKVARGGLVGMDTKLGIIEAFAAAIGNKDSVGDIIPPGAFNASLRRRKPRVVWGHDWNKPIGKVLEIYEVPSNDPRLPAKMRASGVGGLYIKVQFNLNSERGRQAFADVEFFGAEQEWCVDADTEILTDRGWLRYDQVSETDQAYVLHPELGWGQFEPIEAVNVFEDKVRTLRHIETGGFSALTTAAHRWPVASNSNGGSVRWTTTQELDYRDRIVRAAPRFDAPEEPKYSDAFVELVGWFWTEGWVPPADHSDSGLYIAQSAEKNPQHVSSIRMALQKAFPGQWSESHSKDDMARFRLTREASERILEVTGGSKEPTPHFLIQLTSSQLRLLIDTCMNGDGHETITGQRTWHQVAEPGVRSFEMLCALAGQPTNTTSQRDYGNRYGTPPDRVSLLKSGVAKPLDAIRVKRYNGKRRRTIAIDAQVEHEGIVWCPTTPSGTWLARRNGSVYFTGNSIGYKTIDKDYDHRQKANILKEIELYEVSPVLHGANQLTATLSVKDAAAVAEVDFTETEEKAGRVIANRNMDKLRRALALLQDVVSDGEIPEPLERKLDGKSVLQAFEQKRAHVGGRDLVFGNGKTVSGVTVILDTKSSDEVAAILDATSDLVCCKGYFAQVPPSENGGEIILYLPGAADTRTAFGVLMKSFEEIPFEVDARVETIGGFAAKDIVDVDEIFADSDSVG